MMSSRASVEALRVVVSEAIRLQALVDCWRLRRPVAHRPPEQTVPQEEERKRRAYGIRTR